MVTAARARGVPVEYLLFREEGHELLRVRNKEAFVARTVEWLSSWLCPKHPEPEAPALVAAPEASGKATAPAHP